MTLLDLRTRTLKRLDQDVATPAYWTAQEITDALNQGQRLFAFATLCLESIATFALTPGTAFYPMLSAYPDWLIPLRVAQAATGLKVEPATLDALDALDTAWSASAAAPTEYGCLGFDLFFVHGTTGSLSITYARMPATLAADTDQAEIIDAYQPCLIDYAIGKVRAKQGGEEFARSRAYFQRFLLSMQAAAEDNRARAQAAGHDREPFELTKLAKQLAKGAQ